MLRATIWTVGLFGAGTAICRAFPATWTEPVVLFVLGIALLYVSARATVSVRTARATRPEAAPRPAGTAATVAAVAPKVSASPSPVEAAAAVSVQVEQPA